MFVRVCAKTKLKLVVVVMAHPDSCHYPSHPKPRAAVYVGTFDPFHRGHFETAKAALEHLAPDGVVVCVVNSRAGGSSHYKPAALPAAVRRDMVLLLRLLALR